MTVYELSDLPRLETEGRAAIVRTADEPAWAHVYAPTPDGRYQAVIDFHLACNRATGLTQCQGDGSRRHVCWGCALDAATMEGEQ